jgi:hypothetical protein
MIFQSTWWKKGRVMGRRRIEEGGFLIEGLMSGAEAPTP